MEAAASALRVVHRGGGAGEAEPHGGGRVPLEVRQCAREVPPIADEAIRVTLRGEQVDDAAELADAAAARRR